MQKVERILSERKTGSAFELKQLQFEYEDALFRIQLGDQGDLAAL